MSFIAAITVAALVDYTIVSNEQYDGCLTASADKVSEQTLYVTDENGAWVCPDSDMYGLFTGYAERGSTMHRRPFGLSISRPPRQAAVTLEEAPSEEASE